MVFSFFCGYNAPIEHGVGNAPSRVATPVFVLTLGSIRGNCTGLPGQRIKDTVRFFDWPEETSCASSRPGEEVGKTCSAGILVVLRVWPAILRGRRVGGPYPPVHHAMLFVRC